MNSNIPQPDPNCISEDDFVEIWGAHGKESGDLYSHHDVKDLPLNTVWTVVSGDDDSLYAVPGFHVVNKEGYVVTTKPWDDEGLAAYWFFDDFETEDEEDDEEEE